jgi:uncharacterized protein YcfJ
MTKYLINKEVFNMKTLITGLVVAGAALFAMEAKSETVLAPIVDIQPLAKTVSYEESRQVCEVVERPITVSQPVYGRQPDQFAPLVGALVGGAIARGITKGSHRNEAAIVGAVLGGYSQRNRTRETVVGYQNQTVYQRENVCRTEYIPMEKTIIDGYKVTFDHEGQTKTAIMQQKPLGDYVRVETTVTVY